MSFKPLLMHITRFRISVQDEMTVRDRRVFIPYSCSIFLHICSRKVLKIFSQREKWLILSDFFVVAMFSIYSIIVTVIGRVSTYKQSVADDFENIYEKDMETLPMTVTIIE